MNDIALKASKLEKVFGEGDIEVRAVRKIDLEVRRGEVVLIMGPSGSGKTTLLSMLGAMLRPSSGQVVVDGVDLASLPESRLPDFRARTFGFVFQDFNLLGALTATENVEFALNLAGVTGAEARHRAEKLLTEFGLAERLRFRPEKLSGGEKQRVALARALANEPAVILADEPTANLDSKIGHEIARLLERAAGEGRSVVIVSHDERLKDIADRVLWLEDGAFRSISEMATDPVCGMPIERGPKTLHYRHDGTTHFFCSKPCRDEFREHPSRFMTLRTSGAKRARPKPVGARRKQKHGGTREIA